MAKVRVHELAKELGYKSKDVLKKLGEIGEFVTSASSTVEPPVARKIRELMPTQKPVVKAAAKSAVKKDTASPQQASPAEKVHPQASPQQMDQPVEISASEPAGEQPEVVSAPASSRVVPTPAALAPAATAAPVEQKALVEQPSQQVAPDGAGKTEQDSQQISSAPSRTADGVVSEDAASTSVGSAAPSPSAPGPRPAPRPGARPGPRPGNNPFAAGGSSGMGQRPAGPRPGNNPFSAGGTTGMGKQPPAPPTGAPGRATPEDMPRPVRRPGRPGMNPLGMAGRVAGPRSSAPSGAGTRAGRPGAGAPSGRGPGGSGSGRGAPRPGGFGGRGPAAGAGAAPGFGGGPPAGGRGGGRGRPGSGPFGRGGGRARGRKSKKQRRQEFDNLQAPSIGGVQVPRGDGSTVVRLARGSSLTDFAERIDTNPASLVTVLFHLGEMATATQSLDEETFSLLGVELGYDVQVVSPEDEDRELLESFNIDDDPADEPDWLQPRPPVVTVMGHVDHGKTRLLDAIRRSNVQAKEAGGITQHIGAYQAHYNDRALTFIDTPGHEAFTAMRARGVKVTDIAVLVVAADDGVMPQTIEALNHAQAADVPVVVAVNKVDKEAANPARIRQQLTEYGLVAEEYGGETLFVDVSAKQNMGIDDLLEAILLTADASLELRANPQAAASGVSIEGHLDRGRGPIATILVQRGTLNVGDSLVAGNAHGRVRAMLNERGELVEQAAPSRPVQVLGLTSVPGAGDRFVVTDDDRTARQIAQRREARHRNAAMAKARKRVSLEDITKIMEQGQIETLNLILKGDVSGSVEALEEALVKIDVGEQAQLRIIHRGVGAINKSDVMLASASEAIIIGFNVRPEGKVGEMAEREGIDVRFYSVIYQAIDEVESALKGLLKPEYEEVVLGTAEVRELFRSSKVGTIAGCLVRSGEIRRNSKARLIRNGVVVGDNMTVSSLRRFKDDATEVREGFECGIGLGSFNDIHLEDVIETFEMREKPR